MGACCIESDTLVDSTNDYWTGESDGGHCRVFQLDIRQYSCVGRRVRRDGNRRVSPRSSASKHLHRRVGEDSDQRRRRPLRRGEPVSALPHRVHGDLLSEVTGFSAGLERWHVTISASLPVLNYYVNSP